MAAKKKKAKKVNRKTSKTGARKSKRKVARKVIDNVSEPFALLETLKEEGLARGVYLLGLFAGLAKNMTKQGLVTQLEEVSSLLGLATQADVAQIKKRFRQVELRLDELEEKAGIEVVFDEED